MKFHSADYCLHRSERDVYHSLFRKTCEREPRLNDMVATPTGWDRKYKADVQAAHDSAVKRAPLIFARLVRRREYLEACNRATLGTLSPNEARTALDARASGCLHWYECLPIGIDYQYASNATGRSFFIDTDRNAQRWTHYTPNTKPHKGRNPSMETWLKRTATAR